MTSGSGSSGRAALKSGACMLSTARLECGPTEAAATQPAIGLSDLEFKVELRLCDYERLFDSGTPLGSGAFGAVRAVVMLGHRLALKREDGDSDSYGEGLAQDVHSPFVNSAIYTTNKGDAQYTLYRLALGDLSHLQRGLAATAAAVETPAGSEAPAAADGEEDAAAAQQDADARFPAGSQLPRALLRPVFAELVAGGVAMHAAGVRHGDIKPENVLCTADGHVAYGDFGCACPADESAFLTNGTRYFMAPEVAACADTCAGALKVGLVLALEGITACFGRQPDGRPADVFSLGATALCLSLPPAAADAALDAARRGRSPRAAAGPAGAALPAALWDLAESMLSRRPGQRPTFEAIKGHAFFAGVDWAAVEARAAPLPADVAGLIRAGREALQAEQAAAAPEPAPAVPAPAAAPAPTAAPAPLAAPTAAPMPARPLPWLRKPAAVKALLKRCRAACGAGRRRVHDAASPLAAN
jgi:hypothetical protein